MQLQISAFLPTDDQQSKRARATSLQVGSDNSDPETDEETQAFQASQFASQQQSREDVANEPAENGIIETVTCINFMCHKHLTVNLGPLINFVTGHNGSGKSAVLAAITICLGGKATATNRGGSLKNFIKNGEESAMLAVKLKNTSDTGYQQDVYGDSISIERHFTRSGASSFKLKSANGRIISTRKGDLDDICDYFALQIDNPMNVLTQDMARQFLNSSSSAEKYKFFMKGTQLEHLDGDYIVVEHSLDVMDAELYKRIQDVEVYKDEATKAEDLHRISQKNDELRQRIQDLSNMMAWVQVQEQEERLADRESTLAQTVQSIETLGTTLDSLGEGYSQSDNAHTTAVSNLEEAKNAVTPLREAKASVKETHEDFKKEQQSVQVSLR